MPRPTGQGQVFEAYFSNVQITANLYNYDVDGADLKDAHRRWLDDRVVPPLLRYGFHLWLSGHASRSGAAQHNLDLSRDRVRGVVRYLVGKGVSASQLQPEWQGARSADPHQREAEVDRGVFLELQPPASPTPGPSPPSVVPVGSRFQLRVLGAPDLDHPERKLAERIQVRDPVHQLTAYYLCPPFWGFGDDLSLNQVEALPFKSAPWSDFSTPEVVSVTQFGGRADINWLPGHEGDDHFLSLTLSLPSNRVRVDLHSANGRLIFNAVVWDARMAPEVATDDHNA